MLVARRLAAVLTAAILSLVWVVPAEAQSTWERVPSPNAPGSNELLGAAGSGRTQVWAVGRVVDDSSGFRSQIQRWNGARWALVTHPRLPGNSILRGVDAPAPDLAWAAGNREVRTGGEHTLVEVWDGRRWTVQPTPNANPGGVNNLSGVSAVPGSLGAVWAVGTYSVPGSSFASRNLVLQRTGGSWRVVPTPTTTPEDHLEAVDTIGPDAAWAVGWGSTSPFGGTAVPITLRWNGNSWVSVPVALAEPIQLFGVTVLAPDDVWAVGHLYPGGPHFIPLVLHWDGTAWTRVPLPAFPNGGQLRDIVALTPTDVYAVGFEGEGLNSETLVLRWDGASWTRQVTPSPAVGSRLFGAAAVSPGTVWAVGFRYEPSRFANQTVTLRTTGD